MQKNSFFHEAITEAMFLWGTLIVGIALGTGVAASLYVLGTPRASALTTGVVVMGVLFILSEVFYRVGWLPWKFPLASLLGSLHRKKGMTTEERQEILSSTTQELYGVNLLSSAGGRLDRIAKLQEETTDQIEDLKRMFQQQLLDRESSGLVTKITLEELKESANNLTKEGRYKEAVERYEEAFRKAIEENVSEDELAYICFASIRPNYALSEHEKCIDLINKIISLSKNGQVSPMILGEAYSWLSGIYNDFGKYELAQQYTEKAKELRSLPTADSMELGMIKASLGEWKDAEIEYKNALTSSESMFDTGIVLNNLADLYTKQERLVDALNLCKESLDLRIEMGVMEGYQYTRGIAHCDATLGMIYRKLNLLDMAAWWLINAIELFSMIGDSKGVAYQYYELALITLARGRNPEAAERYAQKFVDYYEKNPQFNVEWARGKRLMGMVYAKLHSDRDAEQLLEDSVEALRPIGEKYELGLSCYELGRIKQKLERPEAIEYLMEAKTIFQNLYVPGEKGLENKIKLVDSMLSGSEQTVQWDETKKAEIQRSLEVMKGVLDPEQYAQVVLSIDKRAQILDVST